jgi:hypothetical protein
MNMFGNRNQMSRDSIFAALKKVNFDLVLAREPTPTLKVVDIVLLKQMFNARGQAIHSMIFLLHELLKV